MKRQLLNQILISRGYHTIFMITYFLRPFIVIMLLPNRRRSTSVPFSLRNSAYMRPFLFSEDPDTYNVIKQDRFCLESSFVRITVTFSFVKPKRRQLPPYDWIITKLFAK